MSDIVSPLLEWLNANPQWAGFVTFAISAAESVAVVGTIVPGSITMTAIGVLAGAGIIPLWQTIMWAILGAIVGDGISYWIGHYFKKRLHRVWPFRNNPGLLKTGEVFVHKYGVMSVFIGRFVGPVRALIPLVAGMLGMKPLQFTLANIASAIGWAPAYMLPGILLGAASLELPPDIAIHVILALLLIILFIVLCLWIVYKFLQLIHSQIIHLQNIIWQNLNKYIPSATTLIQHYDRSKIYGQLSLALLFLITSLLFLSLALYVKLKGPANIAINDVMFHLFRGITIRGPLLDNFVIDITLLGQKQIILPTLIVLALCLAFWKYWRGAFYILMLGVFTAGSIFIFKHLLKIPRPWGILQSPESYSMPSGHATLSATIYIGLAFLIGESVRPSRRFIIYMVAILIAFAVSLSRLYLGAHWFTDVLGSWLLSAALLTLVIIAYQRHPPTRIPAIPAVLLIMITICLSFSFFHYRYFTALKTVYAQINYPVVGIDMGEWWKKNGALPAYRTSLFGFRSSKINIQWVGNLQEIRESLLKEGWSKPPSRNLVSTLHRIADVSSGEYLPLISPQYLDKEPALTLTREGNYHHEKKLLFIHLWDSNRIVLNRTQDPLWVGVLNIVPRSYSWLFRKEANDINIDSTVVFPKQMGINQWEWKKMVINTSTRIKKPIMQKILLIRKKKTINRKNRYVRRFD